MFVFSVFSSDLILAEDDSIIQYPCGFPFLILLKLEHNYIFNTISHMFTDCCNNHKNVLEGKEGQRYMQKYLKLVLPNKVSKVR